MFQCDIWVDSKDTTTTSPNIQNGSVFIYDSNISLIKEDTTGITTGNIKDNK